MLDIPLTQSPAHVRHGSNMGQPLTRREGILKVTGGARYAADNHPAGMLLILFSFTNSTADPWYRIGAATLGGFNGMDAVPPLNGPGTPDASLLPADMFRLCFLVSPSCTT